MMEEKVEEYSIKKVIQWLAEIKFMNNERAFSVGGITSQHFQLEG